MGKAEVPTIFNFKEVSIDSVQKILHKMFPKRLKAMTRYFLDVSEMELNTWQVIWLICLMKLYINLTSLHHIRLQR